MFFFYLNRNKASSAHLVDPQTVIRRLMPFNLPDRSGFLDDDAHSLLVQCLYWNTARSRLEPAPVYDAAADTAAVSWARLDNRDELGKKLGIGPAAMAGYCDTELILKSFLKWQESCIDHLIGDFVFVVHDRRRRKVFCGRDHMGVRPFYYFISDDVFVCATSLAAFAGLKDVPLCIDPQWIAEYLMGLSMRFDRTSYEGIKKLPPAHCLTVTPQHVHLRQYFELSEGPELKLKDSREYADAYRETLETAVRCRLESDFDIGSELSGGLDSSTLAAYAAKFLDRPSRLHTFAFAFFALDPQHIASVIHACRLPTNHIFTNLNEPQAMTIPRSLALLGYPEEHGNATFHETFYRLAETLHIRTLLSGFGGDEFGTTLFGRMVLPGLLLQRRYRELYDRLPGNALFRLLRMIKLEFRKFRTHRFTLPEHNPGFYEALKRKWLLHIVRENPIKQYDLEWRYFERARFDAGYTDLKRFTLEKRWMPFIPTRMEECTLMAAARKIEYRWPLLDIRLVRLFLSIPAEENYYRGMSRYLHRRAVDGVVPKTVAWKPGKNMGSITNPVLSDVDHLLRFSVPDLHPALSAFIDVEKLRRQIGELPSLIAIGGVVEKRTWIIQNIYVVMYLDAWIKHSRNFSNARSFMQKNENSPLRDKKYV